MENFDLLEWELKEKEMDLNRIYGVQNLSYRNVRKEKKLESKKKLKRNSYYYRKEEKSFRKIYQRSVRANLKNNLLNEEYYNPLNKDYKTYGWLTW